jgi:hypothetical protein
MRLNHAFRLSSILLAATGFASLALAISLPSWILTLASAAFALALLRMTPSSLFSSHLQFSALTWNVFLLLAFAGFWIDLFLLSQDLLSAGIHFLVLLLVNKLSNLNQRRDVLQLYAISLIMLLASAALTTQIWYAPFFLVYLVAGVWTLLLFHLVTEHDEQSAHQLTGLDEGGALSWGRITPKFFWTANTMAACALGLTLLLFFSIPRIGMAFLQHNQEAGLRTTGFSELVDLGAIGPVKQDPGIVMRIEMPESIGDELRHAPLYLRGVAYNLYNGKSWSNTLLHRRVLTEFPQGTFTLRTSGTQSGVVVRGLRQDILLEPLDTAVLFGISMPTSVKGDFLSVQADLMGSLQLPFPSHARIHYTVNSFPARVISPEKSASSFLYPAFVIQHYLQVPALDARVIDLARRVTQPATTVLEQIDLIRTHLLTQYRYNLDVPTLQSAHPLEDFLLTRKTGYCEHYATAMVMLLRTLGIPARLVTGFLATEWNQFGHYYTVRQRDAHAWVEVYFPQSGWVTMDPTPATFETTTQTWWESAGSLMDSARLTWDRLFLNYSASDQYAVVQGLRGSGEAMRASMSESLTSVLRHGSTMLGRFMKSLLSVGLSRTALVLLLAITVGFLVMLTLRRDGQESSHQDVYSVNQRAVITLYSRMIACLAQHGIVKAASATPVEFLRHVHEKWAEAWPSAHALTELYTRVRFGHAPLTAQERSTADNLLQSLHALGKSAPPLLKR